MYATYLDATSLKGVSSMKLHHDFGVPQKTAWFMQQRIREAFRHEGPAVLFEGPVEVDETYVGGKERHKHRRGRRGVGGGTGGRTAVVGIKDRATGKVAAEVVRRTDAETLKAFISEHVDDGAMVYTDEAALYGGLANHAVVKHSVGQYVDGHVRTNSIESFWTMLKRAHKGTFHKLSPKHLQHYVDEFAAPNNFRELDTLEQMEVITESLAGKRLRYRDLIAPNGLPSGARPTPI